MFLLLSAIFLPVPFLLSLLLLHPQCCWRALPRVAGVPAAACVSAIACVLNVASDLTVVKKSLLSVCPCCVSALADPGVAFISSIEGIPGAAFCYVVDSPGIACTPAVAFFTAVLVSLLLLKSLLLLVLLLFWCLCCC